MARLLRSVGAAALAAWLGFPGVARANGRYPTANQLVVDPANPARIVVRSTIGVLMSADAGKTWSWICESAYSSKVLLSDPAIGITADGSILVGGTMGMSRGTADGCSFAVPTGSLVGQSVVDLAVEPANRAHAYAIYGIVPEGGALNEPPTLAGIARSLDNGATWTDVTSVIDDFTALTIDVAPSNPDVLYASGHDAVAAKQLLFRSDDAGKTWKRGTIPGSGNVYIAAIDPVSPDTLYVRTDEQKSLLMESEDGGATFHQLLAATAPLLGFALSPDGKRIAVGSEDDGLFILDRSASDAGVWTMESVRPFQVECLAWAGAGLYGCSYRQNDGFAIGLSTDGGPAFTPLLHLADLSPLACADHPGRCTSDWCAVAPTIDIDAGCAPATGDASAIAADALPDMSVSSPSTDASVAPAPLAAGGCSCRFGVGRDQEGSTISALLCALVVAWRTLKRTSKTGQNGMANQF